MIYAVPLSGGETVGLLVDEAVFDHCERARSYLDSFAQADGLPPKLHLSVKQGEHLHLQWYRVGNLARNQKLPKPVTYELHYETQMAALRSYPAPKQGAFNQALGKKTKNVLDATGGWGGDAFLMALQGYSVTVQERHPLMALLMHESFERVGRLIRRDQLPVTVPHVSLANSVEQLPSEVDAFDCVYLDPMFPPKRKKSAASNKQMQLSHWLLGEDQDAGALLGAVLDAGFARVAVKRPDYAEPLLHEPEQRFSSKLVHYDVYLNTR